MITFFNEDEGKAYQLFPRKEWIEMLYSGKCKAYDIKWDKFYGVEITDSSSPKARSKRDKYFKKKGLIPYESLADFIKNEEVVFEPSERVKDNRLRRKKRKDKE